MTDPWELLRRLQESIIHGATYSGMSDISCEQCRDVIAEALADHEATTHTKGKQLGNPDCIRYFADIPAASVIGQPAPLGSEAMSAQNLSLQRQLEDKARELAQLRDGLARAFTTCNLVTRVSDSAFDNGYYCGIVDGVSMLRHNIMNCIGGANALCAPLPPKETP